MNLKYFDHILKHLQVVSACVLLGALARVAFLYKGVDDYTANIIFWCVSALFIVVYASIVLFLDAVIKNKKILPEKTIAKVEGAKLIPIQDFEKIRQIKQKENIEKEKNKADIAVKYVQEQFAPYTSDEHLNLLCDYVILYSEKQQLDNVKPVKIKSLSNLDLQNFGWNIWNHFNISNQTAIASFLKEVFMESFKDSEVHSIKSHLRNSGKDIIITIKENLSDHKIM